MMSTTSFAFQQLPKAELHLHLTGAYPLSYLKLIATAQEFAKIQEGIKKVVAGVPYEEAFQYFKPIENVVNTYARVEDGVVALCEDLIRDRVVYAEIRTGLKSFGQWPENERHQGYREYVNAVLRGVNRCPAEKIKLSLILSIRRDTDIQLVRQTIDLALEHQKQGVVGIDVSGNSTLEQSAAQVEEIKRAKKNGLFLALHVGESFKEIDTEAKAEDQGRVLEEMNPDRLGHAVHLSKSSLDWLRRNSQVPIEVCPSSSVMAGMLNHLEAKAISHPWIKQYSQDGVQHPVVIGTDDPLLFETTMTQELFKVFEADRVSVAEIKKMIKNSFDFAFLPESEKGKLREKYFSELE